MDRNPNCTACSLHIESPRVCVSGQGNPNAKIFIILEAPTAKEARGNRLLMSDGGQLLKKCLAEADIDPKDVFVSHMLGCSLPYKAKAKGDQLKACRGYLDEEMKRVNPEWIILCGATPLKYIRKAGIMDQHGTVHEVGGRNYFPMISPSMGIRDPSKIPAIQLALNKLSQLIEGSYEEPEEIDWELITEDSLDRFYEEFDETRKFSFDVETNGLFQQLPSFRVNSISFTLDNLRTWVLPLFKNDDRKWARSTLTDIGERAKGKFTLGHNAKFDNNSIFARYGFRFELGHDTMLASHVLDENSPHDLKYQAKIHCGAPDYDDLPLREKLGNLPREKLVKLYRYNAMDTYYTFMLYKYQVQKFRGSFRLKRLFHKLVMPAARAFEEIDYRGHCIDQDKQDQVRIELNKDIARLTKELQAMSGCRKIINWGSPAQVAQILFGKLGIPCLVKTPDGKPSTAEGALLDLKDEYPIIQKLLDLRGAQKNLNTYIDGFTDLMIGNRLYLSTKLHGTVTGRYSSRLHQVPRDGTIRNIFKAPKGYVYFCADFSQIELRLVADASGDQTLRFIFQTGGDVHVETAKEALGVIREPTKEERKAAKAINFGYVYGMGWRKFKKYAKEKYGVELTDQEAKSFRDRFFRLYYGLAPWHQRVKQRVREEGFMVYPSGRVRRLPGVFSPDEDVRAEAERQAINCVDELTECLEKSKGWITYERLVIGDQILTKNPQSGVYEWQEVLRINSGEHTGDIYKYSSRGITAVTTPDHRWLVTSGSHNRWLSGDYNTWSKFKTSRELNTGETTFRIHCSGYSVDTRDNLDLSDDIIQLIGWIVTEGHFKRGKQKTYNITLCQSQRANPIKVIEIEELLNRFQTHISRRFIPEMEMVYWTFSGDLARKIRKIIPGNCLTPSLISSLSKRQLELLLLTMMKGDGCYKEYERTGRVRFSQADKRNSDNFQMIVTLLGKASTLSMRDQTGYIHSSEKLRGKNKVIPGIINWRVDVKSRKFFHNRDTYTHQSKFTIDTVKKKVMWCPTVENGTFIARREGSVYVSGNSPIQGFGSGDLKVMALLALVEKFKDSEEVLITGEVHDSILGWIREDVAEKCAYRIKEIMENPPLLQEFGIEISVPLLVDVDVGGCWGNPDFTISGSPPKLENHRSKK